MRVEPANYGDKAAILALLEACTLPTTDLTASSQVEFFVTRDSEGGLLGCIGLGRYGDAGLLRSLAVTPQARGAGIARELLAHLEAHAWATGIRRLYLLTTTATPFFAKVGYALTQRAEVPALVQRSPEFSSLCPASASCLSIKLPTP